MLETTGRRGSTDYRSVLEMMSKCDRVLAELAHAHTYRSGIYNLAAQVRVGLSELAQLLPGRSAHGYFNAPGEPEGHSTPADQ